MSVRPFVAAGTALPRGALASGASAGLTASFGAAVHVSRVPVDLRPAVEYTRFADRITTEDHHLSLGVDAILPLRRQGVSPYLLGGLGAYHLASTYRNLDSGPYLVAHDAGRGAETDFGWSIGAGLEVPVRGVRARLEAKYSSVRARWAGSYTYSPVTLGVQF